MKNFRLIVPAAVFGIRPRIFDQLRIATVGKINVARFLVGNQMYLVTAIIFMSAVPVRMYVIQIGEHGNLRRNRQIRSLIAGKLFNHKFVIVVQKLNHRPADIAAQGSLVSGFAQDISQHAHAGAFALGPADADYPAARPGQKLV